MLYEMIRGCLLCCICLGTAISALPQDPARQQRVPAKRPQRQEPPAESKPGETTEEQQDVLKIDTNLVTVPVIATSSDGSYVADLRQNEFSVFEDGVKQELGFFATVSAPFHVVLLLDTSASTHEKLSQIQRAAVTFVEQLQTGDRVKVISFDDRVRDLNDFTNDRAALRQAINMTTSGQGTKLYDAFELALSSIRTIPGRRAIVLFSDGVDWRSDQGSFDSTLHWLDEEGVIVYPVRYETRAETERIARQQSEDQTPQLPTIGVIRRLPSGTTAPTFPSDDPETVPTSGQRSKTGPLGLPLPSEIFRRRGGADPDASRYPSPDGLPPARRPTDPSGRPTDPNTKPTDPMDPSGWPSDTGTSDRGNPSGGDSITTMLDRLYVTADRYLNELANRSGGRMVRADSLNSLPGAFANIAAELRTQYLVGYYPANKVRDGKYRKIRVTTTRKSVVVRARPGYRTPNGG